MAGTEVVGYLGWVGVGGFGVDGILDHGRFRGIKGKAYPESGESTRGPRGV